MTGTASNGAGGMGYSKTEYISSGIESKFTNVQSTNLDNYLFTPSSLNYSVSVSGQVSGYIQVAYLVQ